MRKIIRHEKTTLRVKRPLRPNVGRVIVDDITLKNGGQQLFRKKKKKETDAQGAIPTTRAILATPSRKLAMNKKVYIRSKKEKKRRTEAAIQSSNEEAESTMPPREGKVFLKRRISAGQLSRIRSLKGKRTRPKVGQEL